MAHPGVEHAEVVVDLGDRADGGARVPAGGLLVDGDGRREPFDEIDVGLLHLAQELPGVRRQRLHVPPLALGVDRVEGERGFPGAGQAREHDQLVAREVQRDVLEVVLTSTMDDEPLGAHTGASVEASADTTSALSFGHGPGPAPDPCVPRRRDVLQGAAGTRVRHGELPERPPCLPRRNAGRMHRSSPGCAPRSQPRSCQGLPGAGRRIGAPPTHRRPERRRRPAVVAGRLDAHVPQRPGGGGPVPALRTGDRRARRGPAPHHRGRGGGAPPVVARWFDDPDGGGRDQRRAGRRAGLGHPGRSGPGRGSGAALAPRGGVLRRRR